MTIWYYTLTTMALTKIQTAIHKNLTWVFCESKILTRSQHKQYILVCTSDCGSKYASTCRQRPVACGQCKQHDLETLRLEKDFVVVSDSRKAWWPTFVMLCASDATVEVAKVALAEALHERVFLLPFSKDASENLNDYDSPLSFLDSIHTEHVKSKLPNSYTASDFLHYLGYSDDSTLHYNSISCCRYFTNLVLLDCTKFLFSPYINF